MNTFKLYEQLRAAFPKESAEALGHVFSEVTEEIHNTVTKQDFAELKTAVRDLTEAQKRTEERAGSLEAAMEKLALAQQRTEERVSSLGAAVEKLAEAQKRTEERLSSLEAAVEKLAEAQQRTEAALKELIKRVDVHGQRLAKLDGRTLESQFREKASAYLGTVLRRTRVVPVGDLGDDFEGVLTPDEWLDLTRSDVILRGRAEVGGQRCEVYAAVEVSVTLDASDVARAARRAGLLRKKGWRAIAVAAGEHAEAELIALAAKAGVAILQDGQQFNWPEALAAV